eukprot:1152078-Pelagomonas_calceolata.AAC.4
MSMKLQSKLDGLMSVNLTLSRPRFENFDGLGVAFCGPHTGVPPQLVHCADQRALRNYCKPQISNLGIIGDAGILARFTKIHNDKQEPVNCLRLS